MKSQVHQTPPTIVQDAVHLLKQTGPFLLAVVIAFVTAYFAHIFYQRRDKRSRITDAASKMLTSGMRYKATYLKFAEYNSRFQQDERKLTAANHPDRVFEVIKGQMMADHASTSHYEREVSIAQDGLVEAAYILTALLNKKLSSDSDFNEAAQTAIGFSLSESLDSALAKDEIEKTLIPSLEVLNSKCHEIIYRENSWWFRRFLDRLEDSLNGLLAFNDVFLLDDCQCCCDEDWE